MDVASRSRCVVGGLLISVPAVVWLCYVFCVVGMLTGDIVGTLVRRPNPQGVTVVLVGVLALHAGLFLCVKAGFGPARFWTHTGRHLAVASGLAWGLCLFLFAVFAFDPK